jgi:hypothetical protein
MHVMSCHVCAGAGIVEEHGALQDAMFVLAEQAASLDSQYRTMSTERNQFKV